MPDAKKELAQTIFQIAYVIGGVFFALLVTTTASAGVQFLVGVFALIPFTLLAYFAWKFERESRKTRIDRLKMLADVSTQPFAFYAELSLVFALIAATGGRPSVDSTLGDNFWMVLLFIVAGFGIGWTLAVKLVTPQVMRRRPKAFASPALVWHNSVILPALFGSLMATAVPLLWLPGGFWSHGSFWWTVGFAAVWPVAAAADRQTGRSWYTLFIEWDQDRFRSVRRRRSKTRQM